MNQNQGNQGGQNKGGINWGYVLIGGLFLWWLMTQGNLAANTWQVGQNTAATQATQNVVGDLTSAMKGVGGVLGQVSNNMAILSQNQVTLNQRMGTLETTVGGLQTTVNQQGSVLGNINANVLSLQQGQNAINASLQSLVSGSAQPQNTNLMGQMFQGQVPTQLGGMALPQNGVAGVFPGAQPQASNPLSSEPKVDFVLPKPQTTIDANGEMHVVDPYGRVGVQPGGQP